MFISQLLNILEAPFSSSSDRLLLRARLSCWRLAHTDGRPVLLFNSAGLASWRWRSSVSGERLHELAIVGGIDV
jgi:hypothetical protein